MEIKTNCKDCVFASQPGVCNMNRLEYFEVQGATVTYDENHNATINGRYCSALRTEEWAKNKDRFNLPIIARAELLISTEVLIYLDNDENFSEEKLDITLNSLNQQILKPNQVVLVVNKDKANYFNLIKKMKDSGLNYRLDRIMPENDGTRICELDAIDIATKKLKSDYYLIMSPGNTLEDEEFFANIDEALNERLERFVIIKPTPSRGPLISSALSKKLESNVPMSKEKIDETENDNVTQVFNTFMEKVEYLAQKNGHHYLIKNYEEIK